jgi:hypothetical protein
MSPNGKDDRTMVERVAEAIWMSNRPEGAPDYNELNNMDKFQVEAIARDCLKAMRGPTKDMIEAGYPGLDALISDETTTEIWNDMIDAALKED